MPPHMTGLGAQGQELGGFWKSKVHNLWKMF
jgi:hypothetical protein